MVVAHKDRPHELSAWVRGTVTIHFEGAVVERSVSQRDARTLSQMVAKERSADVVDWAASHWFTFAEERVLFADFKVDEDYGWPLEPKERETLKARGHEVGFMHTLVRFWDGQGREPRYSARAMGSLFAMALENDVSTFERLAEALEGEEGAVRLRQLIDAFQEGDGVEEPNSLGEEEREHEGEPSPADSGPVDR